MNWVMLVVVSYVAVVLETALGRVLAIGEVSPGFVLVVAVYVGMKGPTGVVLWVFLMLGLVQDLRGVVPMGEGETVTLVGPMALGYLAGGVAVLQLRGMVLRDTTLSLVALVFVAGIFVALVSTAVLSVRNLGLTPGEALAGWRASDALVSGFLELVYTSVVAVGLGLVLMRTSKWWGFAGRGHF